MKKYLILLLAAAAIAMTGCSKDDNGDGGNGGNDNTNETGLVFEEKQGTATTYTIGDGTKHFYAPKGDYVLDVNKKYLLKGWVYIQNGSTITIPAGTIIKGDKATMASLIIEPGAKIYAEGTPTKPIVFTSAQPAGSRKPGDWGGLIVCGRARNNQGKMQIEGGPTTFHGEVDGIASDDADNSGVLRYLRVEFAGFPFDTDKEINGITFGSVGSGTQVDHLQVSYSNDDSFEWFGGSVSCSYLVAYHGWDDDFDTDNGFSGKMQFLLGVRNPKLGDQSVSNGFESDNCSDGANKDPHTTAVFSNVTLIGPMGQSADYVNQTSFINGGELYPNNGSRSGQFQAGVQIRRDSRISLYNSVVMGYPVGIMFEQSKGEGSTQEAAKAGLFKIQNVFFAGIDKTKTAFDNTAANPLWGILASDVNKTWAKGNGVTDGIITDPANTNTIELDLYAAKLIQPNSLKSSFSAAPASGSPLVNAALSVPQGFDARGNGYAGAFKDANDNWMAGWTNFDPQNTTY